MEDNLFQSYSKMHVHFYGEDVSRLLELALTLVNNHVKKFSMLDLGCGDGRLIFALSYPWRYLHLQFPPHFPRTRDLNICLKLFQNCRPELPLKP